jgi:hypothetical protein
MNRKVSHELEKKVSILRYILVSKNFVFSLRKQALWSKNKNYNKQISYEYNRSRLLRKIFKIIFEYYRTISDSRRSIKE